jgi:hypothetical protein
MIWSIAMTRGKRKTAWLVIVLYLTVASAREGLHLLPGCGHAVHLSGGELSPGSSATEAQSGDSTGVSQSTADADGCPICKFCLLPVYGGSTAITISGSFIPSSAIWFSEPNVPRNVGSSFLSRGPPMV